MFTGYGCSDDPRISEKSLFVWAESGPPLSKRRSVEGADLYEDIVEQFAVTYFVGDVPKPYIAIVRLREVNP